ncbi:hypothetical protein BH23BAC1_BH23BAC1_29860 [soil metagenome]
MNIMSHIIILLISLIALFDNNPHNYFNNNYRNPGKADTVNWNVQRKLIWEDFKGIPNHHSNFSAETHYVITYTYKKNSYRDPEIKFRIHCYFEKDRSWSKEHHRNSQLLHHEQAHFDIAELHTRMFRERVAKTTFDPQKYEDQIKRIFSEILTECSEMQNQFDKETKFGILREEQDEWVSIINKNLSEFETYSIININSSKQQAIHIENNLKN